MSPRHLLRAFEQWRESGADLVLATVYETAGSTYSKAGAKMLIDADGNFQGMLSGGCLEGDLAVRAADVLAAGVPQRVTYDLGRNDEELWGLGVGCDGLIKIFLQPLRRAGGYQPFAAMASVYSGLQAGAAATVLNSGADGLTASMSVVQSGDGLLFSDVDAESAGRLSAGLNEAQGTQRSQCSSIDFGDGSVDVLFSCLLPPPNVLVLGAGLDAQPVVRLIAELGWRLTIQDHRPAYIANGDFSAADRVLNCAAGELLEHVDIKAFDAAIIMSHHLQTDRQYLALLADTTLAYIGLLGPRARRRRLLEDLGPAGERMADRIHGPAGLDIGGRGPASIALSIVAELHQALVRDDV